MKNYDFGKVSDTDFSLYHSLDITNGKSAFHFHDFFEIYFSMTGGIKYFVNNQVYPVEKNDIFTFNHLDLHRIDIPSGIRYERIIITFNQAYIKELCTGTTNLLACFLNRNPDFCHRLHLSGEQAQIFLSLFKKAEEHYQSHLYGDDVYRKIILTEILIFINRLYSSNYVSMPAYNDTKYDRIKPVLAYINENLQQKLSLDSLAHEFYISKSHLCKVFKEVTGFTLNDYIIHHRISRAAELLRNNLTVSQVSEMTGFQNDCHFITTFKRILNITPKQYAKRVTSDQSEIENR